MSSKELLIKELEELGPLEILQVRTYLHELKAYSKKSPANKGLVNINIIRQSLSGIKGSLSDLISQEREDRI